MSSQIPTAHREVPLSPRVAHLEHLPQAVVAHRRDLRPGERIPGHRHHRHQLIHAHDGVMQVLTPHSAFIVPPECGVWMPGGTAHEVHARTAVAMRTVYLSPTLSPGSLLPALPAEPCVLQVRALLRELIQTLAERDPDYPPASAEARIAAVILDELCRAPVTPLALPRPKDPRLAPVLEALMATPSDPRPLADWADLAGTSERTFTRLFQAETGMSFRRWRQQRRLLAALELLARGHGVTTVALELGYESPSAFGAMFKRCLGVPPGRYFP